jgi:hypothetical protein
MKKIIVVLMLLIFCQPAFSEMASSSECVERGPYTDFSFMVFKPLVRNGGVKEIPNDVAWILSEKNDEYGQYRFTSFMFSQIIDSAVLVSKGSVNQLWDTMSVSYSFRGKLCVFSIPFSGAVSSEMSKKKYIYGYHFVRVNGDTYRVNSSPYPVFYAGLEEAAYIPPFVYE